MLLMSPKASELHSSKLHRRHRAKKRFQTRVQHQSSCWRGNRHALRHQSSLNHKIKMKSPQLWLILKPTHINMPTKLRPQIASPRYPHFNSNFCRASISFFCTVCQIGLTFTGCMASVLYFICSYMTHNSWA